MARRRPLAAIESGRELVRAAGSLGANSDHVMAGAAEHSVHPEETYPLLLSPPQVGPLLLRNRLVMGSMHRRLPLAGKGSGLHIFVQGKAQSIAVDDVVICAGQEAIHPPVSEFEALGVPVHLIGGAHAMLSRSTPAVRSRKDTGSL
jgi:hypothetical protein